jgi:hypothetical protein
MNLDGFLNDKRNPGQEPSCWIVMASESKSDSVVEFYLRAAEARRMAETATDPIERADFLAIEQRWLTLARESGSEE